MQILCLTGYKTAKHLAALLLLVWLPVSALAWEDLPPEATLALKNTSVQTKIEHNETVTGSFKYASGNVGISAWAAVYIPASIQAVTDAILRCKDAPKYYKKLKACRVVKQGDRYNVFAQELKLAWFLPRLKYLFRADFPVPEAADKNTPARIRFSLLSGDLKALAGGWNLYPHKQGIIAVYFIHFQPEFYLPAWLARAALKSDLPETMAVVKKLAIQP